MSKPISQTQTPKSFFEAPVFTKEELESKLKDLQSKLDSILEDFNVAHKKLLETHYKFFKMSTVSIGSVEKLYDAILAVRDRVYDIIDEMIVNELDLDTDIEKYEEEYKVHFGYTEERLLGVVMLKENDTVKPVVVWTDYREVGYYEGEKSE
jgi:hypothetical protein